MAARGKDNPTLKEYDYTQIIGTILLLVPIICLKSTSIMTHLTKKIILDAIKYSASLDNSFISGWWICNDDNTVFLPLLQVARRVYNDEFDYAYELDYAETFKKTWDQCQTKKR